MSNPTIKVKATVMYPYLTQPNDRFNPENPKYEVSLAQLSEKAVEAIEGIGVKVYHKPDQGHKISCKSTMPIRVYDTEGNEIDGSIVGNESEAVAILSFYENRYGKFPQLNRLVITKLVEYKPNEGVKVSVDDDDDIL
jgi:hypothetical protein